MPRSVYGARDLVAVKPIPGINFLYGFRTNTLEAQRTVLGQIPGLVGGAYINGLVIGANAPKPAKASKPNNGSSFCDIDKIDDARADGWTISARPKIRRGGIRGKSKIVYVTVSTGDPAEPGATQIKYAWPIRNTLYDRILAADRTALGINDSDRNDRDLVFGASFPELPVVQFTSTPATGRSSVISTFCDPDRTDTLPTGWTSSSSEEI